MMRVFNQEKTQELKEYDLTKGYLKQDILDVHKDFIEEKGHYELVKEYPNGGKDYKWVIDTLGQEEEDHKEDIYVYIPFSEEDILNFELSELIAWFDEYDNQVKQYERCIRLGVEFDKDIQKLDNEATQKQLRIREIRSELYGK